MGVPVLVCDDRSGSAAAGRVCDPGPVGTGHNGFGVNERDNCGANRGANGDPAGCDYGDHQPDGDLAADPGAGAADGLLNRGNPLDQRRCR